MKYAPLLFVACIGLLIVAIAPRTPPVTVKYGNAAKLAFVYDCAWSKRTDCAELAKRVNKWPM